MSRIKLLQSSEVKVFDSPSVFSYEHRLQFFGTDDLIQSELGKLRTPYSKLGFLIQLGYFKWTGRFFEVGHFRGKDIEHLMSMTSLGIKWNNWLMIGCPLKLLFVFLPIENYIFRRRVRHVPRRRLSSLFAPNIIIHS